MPLHDHAVVYHEDHEGLEGRREQGKLWIGKQVCGVPPSVRSYAVRIIPHKPKPYENCAALKDSYFAG